MNPQQKNLLIVGGVVMVLGLGGLVLYNLQKNGGGQQQPLVVPVGQPVIA